MNMNNFEEFEKAFNELPEWKQEYLLFSAKFQGIFWLIVLISFIIYLIL